MAESDQSYTSRAWWAKLTQWLYDTHIGADVFADAYVLTIYRIKDALNQVAHPDKYVAGLVNHLNIAGGIAAAAGVMAILGFCVTAHDIDQQNEHASNTHFLRVLITELDHQIEQLEASIAAINKTGHDIKIAEQKKQLCLEFLESIFVNDQNKALYDEVARKIASDKAEADYNHDDPTESLLASIVIDPEGVVEDLEYAVWLFNPKRSSVWRAVRALPMLLGKKTKRGRTYAELDNIYAAISAENGALQKFEAALQEATQWETASPDKSICVGKPQVRRLGYFATAYNNIHQGLLWFFMPKPDSWLSSVYKWLEILWNAGCLYSFDFWLVSMLRYMFFGVWAASTALSFTIVFGLPLIPVLFIYLPSKLLAINKTEAEQVQEERTKLAKNTLAVVNKVKMARRAYALKLVACKDILKKYSFTKPVFNIDEINDDELDQLAKKLIDLRKYNDGGKDNKFKHKLRYQTSASYRAAARFGNGTIRRGLAEFFKEGIRRFTETFFISWPIGAILATALVFFGLVPGVGQAAILMGAIIGVVSISTALLVGAFMGYRATVVASENVKSHNKILDQHAVSLAGLHQIEYQIKELENVLKQNHAVIKDKISKLPDSNVSDAELFKPEAISTHSLAGDSDYYLDYVSSPTEGYKKWFSVKFLRWAFNICFTALARAQTGILLARIFFFVGGLTSCLAAIGLSVSMIGIPYAPFIAAAGLGMLYAAFMVYAEEQKRQDAADEALVRESISRLLAAKKQRNSMLEQVCIQQQMLDALMLDALKEKENAPEVAVSAPAAEPAVQLAAAPAVQVLRDAEDELAVAPLLEAAVSPALEDAKVEAKPAPDLAAKKVEPSQAGLFAETKTAVHKLQAKYPIISAEKFESTALGAEVGFGISRMFGFAASAS